MSYALIELTKSPRPYHPAEDSISLNPLLSNLSRPLSSPPPYAQIHIKGDRPDGGALG